MRIAVFSDVHANLPALEAALKFIRHLAVDEVLCLGDLVGYGPHPREVIELVRQRQIPCLLGGTDARIAFPLPGPKRSPETEAAMAWTREQLDHEDIAFLRSLPTSKRFRTPVGRARAFHGHPENPEARFPLYEEEAKLRALLEVLRAKLVLTGGSHIPVARTVADVHIVDPGSVGLTLGGEPGADLAVVTVNTRGVTSQFYKVPYDYAQTAFDIQAWGLPERIAEMVRTGRPLDPED